MANQPKKALNEAILKVEGLSRKPMTPVEKLKLAGQHKGKVAASTGGSVTSTAKANVLPSPHLPSPPHMVDERRPSPPHSPSIIIMDNPLLSTCNDLMRWHRTQRLKQS